MPVNPCKVVVFSEYQDTVRHIAPILDIAFPGRVLAAEGSLGKGFLMNCMQTLMPIMRPISSAMIMIF